MGKSKKVAKRNAALSMIQLLKQGVVQPQPDTETEPTVEYDPDSIPLVSQTAKSITLFVTVVSCDKVSTY